MAAGQYWRPWFFAMTTIRRASPEDCDALLALWERSVRATHAFLREEDIAFYKPLVEEFLVSDCELWVACDDASGAARGFMMLDGEASPAKLEALFVDPAASRGGIGSALVRHAHALKGRLVLDVNEQNPGALAFYARLGFVRTGRSPLDGAGKPFPLIHMERPA